MKICNVCGANKEISDFHKNKNTKDGHSGTCKVCACARTTSHHVHKVYPVIIDLDGEEWKELIGGEGGYFISNLGRLKRIDNRLYSPEVMKLGYIRAHINKKKTLVHVLVATHFIPNPDNKTEVNHKNGIKSDNRACNLEWSDRSHNLLHAYRVGLKSNALGKNPSARTILNMYTVIFYDSIKEAADSSHYQYRYLITNLCQNKKNKTPFQYAD